MLNAERRAARRSLARRGAADRSNKTGRIQSTGIANPIGGRNRSNNQKSACCNAHQNEPIVKGDLKTIDRFADSSAFHQKASMA
ncbi:hypothetical protein [Burkholderia lata]|uniref:hypothetical protein n=1 Tax=Burkholderia lata (strain ATCC 17760 / DSM 23089 / LMG 22485 / NCIMB 9086 / R18194 / 383) TaxID=482957 RepID=UPI0015823F16|nr:hypothetical protein [Burkholderia lata]